jgi:Family of unknown function (DUF5317)
MLLLLTIVAAAIVAGYVMGGGLSGFERLKLKWWGLAPGGLALQFVSPTELGGVERDTVGLFLLVGSYVPLLVFAARNVALAGYPLILAGLALNLLVIFVNGGMAVTEQALVRSGQEDAVAILREEGDGKHHLADEEEDVLLVLGDVIPVGWPFQQVVSAGDLVLYAGVAWMIVAVMRGRSGGLERTTPYWIPAGPPPRDPPPTIPSSGTER